MSSKEFASFRGSIPLKVITVSEGTDSAVEFRLYDHGPKEVRCPLVLLPPAAGTADCFFSQVMFLGAQGLRVIAVDHPDVWTVSEWVHSFVKLLDALLLDQIHVLGAGLGGFLAQMLAAATVNTQRVQSIMLINSFADTSPFHRLGSPGVYKWMPAFALRSMLLADCSTSEVESSIADSIDFMVELVGKMSQRSMASRMALSTTPGYIEVDKISAQNIKIMIVDVPDQTTLSTKVKEEMLKLYPSARVAHLKDGGNFPFVSRSSEVNMFVKLALRPFQQTRYSAGDDYNNAVPTPAAAADDDEDDQAAAADS